MLPNTLAIDTHGGAVTAPHITVKGIAFPPFTEKVILTKERIIMGAIIHLQSRNGTEILLVLRRGRRHIWMKFSRQSNIGVNISIRALPEIAQGGCFSWHAGKCNITLLAYTTITTVSIINLTYSLTYLQVPS